MKRHRRSLSTVSNGAVADFIERTIGYPAGMDRNAMLHAAGVPETAMRDFLDGLDQEWGGAVEFLKSAGVTEDQMQAVRDRFLDD